MRLEILLAVLVAFFCISWAQTYSSAWKVDKLDTLSKSNNFISMDSRDFDKYVEGPRNFSIVAMFTAMNPKQNCHICLEVYPEFEIVSRSWSQLGHQGRLYFAVIDYQNAQDIFARFKFSTAPIIIHFPPNEGPYSKPSTKGKFDQYDLTRNGGQAEDIALYVQAIVQSEIPVKRPLNFVKILSPIILLVIGGFLARYVYSKVERVLKNPYVWAFLLTTFVLIMIGGQMWNSIRGPPYTGREEVISGSFQQQFAIETRIVATLYGIGALAIVGLVQVPNSKTIYQRHLIYFCSFLFIIAVSLIIFVFRIKNKGYPFKLLF